MRKLALLVLSSPTLVGSALSLLVTMSPARAADIANQPANGIECQRSLHTGRLTCARLALSANPKPAAVSSPIQVAQSDVTPASVSIPVPVAPSDELPSETGTLEFSEEESDTSIALFGCDCVICINAIRQMRGLPPLS